MDYLKWLIEWFEKNSGIEINDIENHVEENYFELGYIDSFGFIMLISSIEEEFKITFDNERFQDRSFSTIKGLAIAIETEIVR